MSLRFVSALIAAALLPALPALAAERSATYDDTTYPAAAANFATAFEATPIVTPDVTYPGPHAVLTKRPAAPATVAVATRDDVWYPTADAPRSASPAALATNQVAAHHDAEATVPCHCDRG